MAYISNYDFIPYGGFEEYQGTERKFDGYFDINVTCITNIHIGSGFYTKDNDWLQKDSVKFQNNYIIPGSSFKGAVRTIASAVSNSCFKPPCSGEPAKACIVCDMFGTMKQASRVMFSDLKSVNATTEISEQCKQYSSQEKKHGPENKETKCFKFYKTHCEKYDGKEIHVKTISKNSIFTGRIHVSKLTNEQLSLLLFSMGIDESFDIKLGGYKNEGLGHVRVRVVDSDFFQNKSAKELSEEYPSTYGRKKKEQIEKLREILKP